MGRWLVFGLLGMSSYVGHVGIGPWLRPLPMWAEMLAAVVTQIQLWALILVPYLYLRSHGWTMNPKEWIHRCGMDFASDWAHGSARGWQIDWLLVRLRRDHNRGTLSGWLSLAGLTWHWAVLIDAGEFEAFRERDRQSRIEALASVPPEMRGTMRQMLESIPLGQLESLGAMVEVPVQDEHEDTFLDDEDDDDGPPTIN